MSRARRRHARRAKELPADQLGHIAAVLHGIVEVNLVQAVKSLAVPELVELEREGRFIVEVPRTAGCAFKMNAHLRINFVAIVDGRPHISAAVPLQGCPVRAGDFNL